MRQEAHTRLLKSCGGSGNRGMEPPRVFVPHDMMSEGRCTICEKSFSHEADFKNHISDEHKAEVKKAFSKKLWKFSLRRKCTAKDTNRSKARPSK